jgi:hypothetical protein
MTDDELHEMLQEAIAKNIGDYVKNPFYKSAIAKQKKRDLEESEDEVEEELIDYSPESEEIQSSEKLIINEDTIIEDFPDISEDDLIL